MERVLVRQLVEDYAAAVDGRDLDRAAGLFTDRATLTLPDVPTELGPCIEHRGRAAIRVALDGVAGCLRTLHAVVTHTASVTAQGGTGRTGCLAHHLVERPSGVEDWVWAVTYDDRYLLDHGVWRFAARSVSVDWIEVRPVRYLRAHRREAQLMRRPVVASADGTVRRGHHGGGPTTRPPAYD